MMANLMLAALVLTPVEKELQAKLPDVFSRSAAQYRLLLKTMSEKGKDMSPKRYQDGKVVLIGPRDWCSGFFPGSLWYLYEQTGEDFWKAAAADYTERIIEPLWNYHGDHDIGFRAYCAAGNAYRLTQEDRYAEFLRAAAGQLRLRFDDSMGLIRSWDGPKPRMQDGRETPDGFFDPRFIVIIDNMMNLELLEWDAKNDGDARSDRIARSQADSTDRHHFRSDGSAYHILSYTPGHPDRVFGAYAGQGASVEGTWARGHSWAIYGFTMMYRETKDARYLERARKSAAYWMHEPRLPPDGVPYWDFSAIGEERDASAAAVTSSALIELSQLVGDQALSSELRTFAAKTLLALVSPAYFSAPGANGGFLLMHSVGVKPYGSEVDVPMNYADYYFLEALLRFKRISAGQCPPLPLEGLVAHRICVKIRDSSK